MCGVDMVKTTKKSAISGPGTSVNQILLLFELLLAVYSLNLAPFLAGVAVTSLSLYSPSL